MDCFALSHNDMVGIDPSVISHKLSVNPSCTPVQQKRRKFAAERNEVINKEVDSLLAADKIREVSYPEWLSNVVVVPKKNGKWRVCVDFTDLNKACPKDPFPLPHIDAMVDATAGHEVLTFLDAWSGYNQIKMHPQDQEKTAFMSERELKSYLSTPPLLAKPEQGEPLFLYLSVTEAAVSAVLVKEQEGVQHPIYYISKSLLPAETRTAIKSQALTDFVSDFCPATHGEAEEGMLAITRNQDGEIWTLYIDGASNARGAGVGLVLRSPKGDMIVQAIRCEFKATNNEAEYEALILGMQIASGLKVRNLRVYSDSLLVVPREQNVEADALATLGSTFHPTELSNIPITHVLTPAIQREPDQRPVKEDVHMQCAQGARTLVSTVGQQDADWRVPYLNWLRDGTLPEDRKEAQSFRIKASGYIMIDNILLRKSLAGPCLGA
ncbi:uncharacterized protein LOC141651780 [Silene latifolia]|uniref:uncharacterized protein LOC141651780 n=1 Tax=Silene latifolia TaxID=37657 RepID=UPI003D7735DC